MKEFRSDCDGLTEITGPETTEIFPAMIQAPSFL